jgi:hypothetical protein
MNTTIQCARPRYCVAVSLGAKVLVADYFAKVRHYAEQYHYHVECCLLDVPEIANMKHLMELDESKMSDIVDQQVDNMRQMILGEFPEATVTKWSEYSGISEFQRYLHLLEDEYATNKSFRNHCHSQTYSNLEPVLRSKGIVKKSHPTVASLSGYLISELALLLYLEKNGNMAGFIAPRHEMQIQTSLAEGKYHAIRGIADSHKPTIKV